MVSIIKLCIQRGRHALFPFSMKLILTQFIGFLFISALSFFYSCNEPVALHKGSHFTSLNPGALGIDFINDLTSMRSLMFIYTAVFTMAPE